MLSEAVRESQREMGRSGVTDRLHYCYRCTSCGRLITKLEILGGRCSGSVNLCTCGSRTIRPTNAKWWEELFLPRCWRLIYAIYAHRIAPAPESLSKEEQAEADRVGRAASRAFERHVSQVLRSR